MHLYHPDWTIAVLCIWPLPVIDELTAAGSTCHHKITDRDEKEGPFIGYQSDIRLISRPCYYF